MKSKYYSIFVLLTLFLTSCEDLFLPEDETGDPRDKINYLWKCSESSEIYGNTSYDEVFIYAHPTDSSSIYIENFYNLGENNKVKARLSGNTIIIDNGFIDDYIVNGVGNISSNYSKIEWNYSVEHPDEEIDNVTATYTRYEI